MPNKKTTLLSGTLGEGSPFDSFFGIYGDGAGVYAARLPEGWHDRLVRFERANTIGAIGWCLERHDLWISKALAGREKDGEFYRALLTAGLVTPQVVSERLEQTQVTVDERTRVTGLVEPGRRNVRDPDDWPCPA